MKELKKFRQGDVRISQVKKSLEGKVEETKALTIALGEKTGHHHTIHCDVPIKYVKTDEGMTFQLDAPAVIKHQEHAEINLEPGIYESKIQREYDVVSYSRQVLD